MSFRSYLFAVLSAGAVVAGMGAAFAQDASSIWPRDVYLRVEGGGAWLAEDRGHWHGPGPGDPRITFNIDDVGAFIGTAAIGATLYNGVRGDISLSYLSEMDIDANWISPLPGPHANIYADVSSWLIMANLFVEPLALAGYESPIKPFVTGGIGVAFNEMDDWTRINPFAVGPAVRTFDGNTETEFAWSLGGGVSAEVGDWFGTGSPVEIDLTYRYTDAGEAKGGTTPVSDNGNPPLEAFNYDNTFHAVSIGVRIPFSTY